MTVANRLRVAFGVYIALLAGVLLYHVRTIRATERAGQELTAISSRLRITTDQVTRLTAMASDAEKYLVTRDHGYLEQFRRLAHDYGAELTRLQTMPLSAGERARLDPLVEHWSEVGARSTGLAAAVGASRRVAQQWMADFGASIDDLRVETQALGAAAQEAMRGQLEASSRAARAAERISWAAALGALALVFLLSALFERSIIGPLQRLAQGTREVSAGRFDHRLDVRGSGEFAQMASDFNSMTERLAELDRMKRDFVAKVSHDLKTPLSSMRETVAVLLDRVPGPLTEKQTQLLELTRESAVKLSTMLGKLLDLSRIEAGLEPDLQMLDVMQLVDGSVRQANAAHASLGVHVELMPPANLATRRLLVRGDAVSLTQVLDNLIENAVKFSPAGEPVRVAVRDVGADADPAIPGARRAALRWKGLRGSAVLLTVTDAGPGVPRADRERIFERFYQTEAGRAVRGRGVGLGLTICREVVEKHAGAIWASDAQPRGSIFSVLLPGAVRVPEPGTQLTHEPLKTGAAT